MATKTQDPSETIQQQSEEQRKTQTEKTGSQLAASEAGQVQVGKTSPAFLDRLLETDVTAEEDADDDLDQYFPTLTSNAFAVGNVDRERYEKNLVELEAILHREKTQLPRQEGPGSKFAGEFRNCVRPDEQDVPRLDYATDRRFSAIKMVIANRMSLSIEGFLLEALTKIQAAVERISGDESGESSGGRISSAKSRVGGLLKPG